MKRFFLLIIACCCFFSVHAAYLKDVPKTLTQPDGTILHCFASGDEFFNYLHDANGFTIMQHPQTGFYVYADKRGDQLVATDFVAGSVNPASKNLRPYNLISPQEWQSRRNAWHEYEPHASSRSNPNHGTLNNISIFVRFSDDAEFTNTYSSIDNMFNDETTDAVSMKTYFRAASYGSIEIPTYFYPGHSGETIISYQDNHPRSYFQPYNAVTNTNGYQTEDQRAEREFSLLERAVNYINANYPIPSNLNIDYDNDGYVDNVCFIVRGDVGEWSSLLWPHKWALQDRYVYINGKRVWTFNFQLADASGYFNASTMCHEMNHSLGAPDLYHYNYGTNLSPAGIWDLMENDTWPPQHCGAYMKMKYGHWIDEIPEITEGGVYTLNPISSPTPDNVAYKIATEDPYQFYVVEYRDNTSLFESGLPGSGLLVYRIDTRFEGNAGYDPSSGIYDEVYIFRPGGSTTQEGNLSSAFFSANVGRTEFNATTSAYPFFTNGTVDNNFGIYNITQAGNTISFSYGSCDPPTNLTASVENNDVVLSWTAAVGATSYNVYRDGSLIGNTTETSYLDGSPVYGSQTYYVKSMDSNGFLSSASESVEVNYEPEGVVEGHVYEVDGITGIANAIVTLSGYDEFGYSRSNSFTTDANGYYAGTLLAGNYSAKATCGGYQESRYNNAVNIAYNQTTAGVDIVMDEVFYPVSEVVAEYYPDAADPNSPYVKVYWSMKSNWLYYDDGIFQTNIGAGGQFYWGVMFPAGSYSGHSVTKVSMYDYMAHTGNIMIYQGGTTAPATLLYTQTYSCTGIGDFVEWTMNSPVAIDPSQSLWIVMHNDNGDYPASGCASTGDPNGRWVSLDGSTWEDLAGYNLNYTWMLRAVVSNRRGETTVLAHPASTNHTMPVGNLAFSSDPNAVSHDVGTPVRINSNNRSFNHYRVYRTSAYNNGPYTEDNTVIVADNVADTLLIDLAWADVEAGVYKWGVSRVYEGNRGELIESPVAWATVENNAVENVMAYEPATAEGMEDMTGFRTAPAQVHAGMNSRLFRGSVGYVDNTSGSVIPSGLCKLDMDNPQGATSLNAGTNLYSGEIIDGIIYGYDSSGNFLTYDAETGVQLSSVYVGTAIREMAYDYTTHTMYGSSTSENTLYRIDLATGIYTAIGTMSGITAVAGLVCDLSGQLYAMAFTTGDLYKVDKTTAALTLVGNTGRTPAYVQSAAIDYATGVCYWAYSDASYDDLYIVDLSNAATTFLCSFVESCGLCFPFAGNLIQGPRESQIVWSNFVDKNMNLGEGDVDITVMLNSGDSPEGVTVSFTNLNQSEQSLYPIADVTLDATGYYAWNSFRKGDYQVQVSFDGYDMIAENVSIWDATSLNYVLSEIINGISDLYVSRTGWAMWNGAMPGPVPGSADEFIEGFENGLNGWNVLNASGEGTWVHSDDNLQGQDYTIMAHSGTGFAVGYSFIDYVGAVNIDSYLYTPQKYSIVNGSTLTFWADNANDSYPENFSVCVATADNPTAADFTQVWAGGAKAGNAAKVSNRHNGNRSGNWRQHTIDLSAYAGQNVYIAFHDVNYDMYEIWIDDVELSIAAKGDRHFNNYQVELSDGEGNVLYQGTNSDGYMQLPVDNLTDGQTYHLKVASSYSSGMSEWSETDWAYQSCDNFYGVNDLNLEMNDDANVISWEYPTVAERSFVKGDYPAYGCMVYNDGVAEYQNGWFSFDLDTPGAYNYLSTVPYVFGGDYCPLDGNVHATYENNWYVINPETGEIVNQGSLNIYDFYDCAWDYSSGMMYGVYGSDLYMWNVEDNTIVNIGSMGRTMMALACDLDGQLWGISQSEGALYKIDKTTGATTFVGSTGQYCYYVQSAGFDHYTGKLYWTGCGDSGFFAEVDTETGQATVLANNTGEVCSFCVPFDGGSYFSPVTGVLGALLYRDGELLGFTTQTSYTDTIATGSHEYEVRVVYDGMRRCPNYNAYYAMSCPLSVGGASYEVTVAANPAQGGSVTGAGSYVNGFPCTVTATANEGYAFTNWSMEGEEITDTPEYTFRVRDNVNMEANFIGITPHWEVVDNPDYNSQSLIGVVNVDGTELTGNYIEVAALCGDECRGRQMLTYYPEQNRFVVCMTIYGLEGDNITFDLYDHERGEETEFDCLSVLTFNSTSVVGTLDDPYIIRFGITQTTDLQAGWNWYSTIVKQEGNEGLEMLEASLGADGTVIKSQDDGFDINYGNLWMGNLNFITNDQMYMINANAPVEAVVSGISANVSDYPITLYSGWSWIGYPHAVAMDVNDALVDLNASNGDVLKTKHSFSTFVEGQGWFGTLNTLEPAMGMMYNSKKGSNTTFTYSDGSSREELAPNLTAENNHWVSNDFKYPDNMSVMAVVELNQIEIADGDYELAVFANGSCLGSTKLIFVEPINRYMAFLTITGEENQEMNFGLYHAGTGKEYQSASEMLTFDADAIIGSIDEPYIVHFNGSTDLVEGFASARIYPNPVERGALFNIDLTTDKAESVMVEVINALGETVSALRSCQTPIVVKAPNVSGVYTVRLVVEGKGSYSQKLIVR